MTITNKLRLSFAIFIGSLLIPTVVGVKAISAIREHQQIMLDISDLSFLQMKLTSAVESVESIHQLDKLTQLQAHVTDIKQQFSDDLARLKQLQDPWFKEYATSLVNDENKLNSLSSQLFDSHRAFLTSKVEMRNQLRQHHNASSQMLSFIKQASDVAVVESVVTINQSSTYALYNDMKEADVTLWLEAIATLKQQLLYNKNLANQQPLIEQEMAQHRTFVLNMVNTARRHQKYADQQDQLVQTFARTVERNIEHGRHAKRQLVVQIEATAQRTALVKGAVIALMLLIGIAISIYLTRSITTAIARMIKAVKQVGTGNLNFIMQESGNNEFTSLAQAFNHMTNELQQARQEMAQYNHQLEDKISARTIELKHAIEKVEINNKALEKLSAQLSKYLSPQLYQSIFSGKQEVRLETSRKKLTVFFSDIQGFTQLTDTMDPEAMTMVLNVYLDAMTQIALDHGGTIDKFIGDAVMVFFGDPESKGGQQDALACVNMALAMQLKMAELKTYWQSQGYKLPFHIRMGINTGYCTVGNFGAEDRMDYTIIGGNVNLASRLESNAAADQILVSKSTRQLVQDFVECEPLGEIMVKGIAAPVQTYAVVGVHSQPDKLIEHKHLGLDVSLDLSKTDKQTATKQLQAIIKSL